MEHKFNVEERYPLYLFDVLYAKASIINDQLIKKSETPGSDSPNKLKDAMMMQLTSHAMSFMKSVMLNHLDSLGFIFNIRCVIEIQAILNMIDQNVIDETSLYLFINQYKIFEYIMYSRYPELDPVLLSFQRIKNDYLCTIEEYRSIMPNVSEKEFRAILHSPLPFLKDPKTKYESLVRRFTTPQILSIYKSISYYIHPHDFGKKTISLLSDAAMIVLKDIAERLSQVSVDDKRLFTNEHKLLFNPLNQENKRLLAAFETQSRILGSVIDVFDRDFSIDNFVSNVLTNIRPLLLDIGTDLIFGLSEQAKIKWKLVIEIVTAFDAVYFDYERAPAILRLMRIHEGFKKLENLGESTENIGALAYQEYINLYSPNIDSQKFVREFRKPLGYLIDENGNVPSITRMVEGEINELYKNEMMADGTPLSVMLRVLYDESQLLSHATGYMYNANAGAFSDSILVCQSVDYLIMTILMRVQVVFSAYETIEEKNKHRTLINCLRNGIKRYECEMQNKSIIYQTQRVSKGKFIDQLSGL
jgi:hypothetical protein